jgi:acetyl coenzyme A synthetase (ADP forming)-like protein
VSKYPAEYEIDTALRDGGIVRFRPIKPDDSQKLYEFFHRLGPESRYFRFFRVKKDLSPEELEYFTNVSYEDRMAFVAVHEDDIIGVGRYDRVEDDPQYAEVAFAVEDGHQGRGIGSQLLQLMTTHSRKQGITGFRAFVLPENVQMMRLFRNSGYRLERTLDEAVYSVSFPVAYSEDARAAEEEREKRAVAASLLPIFYPRSIAVIGASRNRTSIGGRLFHNLVKGNFSGPVFPVNPNADVVNSVRAYKSVLDIPDAVDLAFLVVPARFALEAVQECAEKGVRGIVMITAGFSELGEEGRQTESDLLEVVRSAGMRMVGPNCMGVLNTDVAVSMDGTFAPVFPPRGNVAMSSQSGALGIAILDYALRNNIGISTFVSVGNKADISGNDLLLYWEGDPATDVIVLYLESFGNPRRFARVAKRIARKKPILAVKSGRTSAGTRAASSHTGALASADVAVDALFHQTGVIRTNTLEELFDVTVLLANQPVPAGRRVGVITNAGGPGILAADALESNGLTLPEFSEELQAKLREVLSEEASTRNPVDLIASAGADEYGHCLNAMLESDEIDAVIASYIPASPTGTVEIAAALREAAVQHNGKKTFLSVFMSYDDPTDLLGGKNVRIPTYLFPEAAAVALARAVRYGEWLNTPEGEIPVFDDIDKEAGRKVVDKALEQLGPEGGWLEPDDVEEVLGSFGIRLPQSLVVETADEAVAAAAKIGRPVAVKVLSPSALHKSDLGGVLLGVQGDDAVREAFEKVTSVVDEVEGVLVQEMVTGGHEILVGMTEDPLFGPLIVFGMGGVLVELVGDVSFRITPVTDVEASEMVREIKSAKLLEGYRSYPAGDIPAVEEVILRVSALADAIPEIREMDLNPVMVLAPGEGAKAVDARIRVVPTAEGWSPELVDLPGQVGRAKIASGS